VEEEEDERGSTMGTSPARSRMLRVPVLPLLAARPRTDAPSRVGKTGGAALIRRSRSCLSPGSDVIDGRDFDRWLARRAARADDDEADGDGGALDISAAGPGVPSEAEEMPVVRFLVERAWPREVVDGVPEEAASVDSRSPLRRLLEAARVADRLADDRRFSPEGGANVSPSASARIIVARSKSTSPPPPPRLARPALSVVAGWRRRMVKTTMAAHTSRYTTTPTVTRAMVKPSPPEEASSPS